MHIGIVAPEFPPDIGGVETYAYEFARELAARGHRVSVLTRRHRGGEVAGEAFDVLPALKLRRHHDSHVIAAHSVDIWHAMNASYAWLALESRPVVVSVHGNDFLRPYVLVERMDVARRVPIPIVRGWLEKIEKERARERTYRLLGESLANVDHVFANSRYTERVFLQSFPACRGRTSTAWVGVAERYLEAPARRSRRDGPVRFITVTRLAEPRKNVDRVLRALSRLRDDYIFEYQIIGDGHLRPQLESLSRELRLTDRVRFRGTLSAEELRDSLLDGDLFVLASSVQPTSHEGFGIVYLEAAACGTPVLAARLGGAVEAVAENVSGYFVESPSVEEIETALRTFLDGRVAFDTDACRAFAHRFTWAKVVDHAERVYERLRTCPRGNPAPPVLRAGGRSL